MKYSINSAGRIVAERDIYSLGGFIPKGRLGGFIADEMQLSQEGECWLSSGNISSRPDVRIKDNAFIGGFFRGENPVHTDIVTEFSGNTLTPGSVSIRCFAPDTKNNMFVKDSFIGVSMDVLCGPESTTTAFPFRQGIYNNNAAKGTLFENMVATPIPVNICRSFADLRLGKDTYLYIPTGYNCRVLWAYYDTSDRLAYSGESTAFAAGLHKLSHPVYKVARMHIAKVNGTAMTPTDLLATGAKILGHISGSVLTDIRPESVSGDYMMVNSSFIAETDNFGLNATQLRFLAGSMYDTTMYTKTDRRDYKPYGTFRNVERLEYTMYLSDTHRTNVNRDRYISAYDCPLLRVDNSTYDASLTSKGNLVLRRCIVPKAEFQDDVINGNTYEDIDFSCANEDLGFTIAGYTRFLSSHKQGLYRLSLSGGRSNGLVSHKGNLTDTARLFQAVEYTPLDGSIMEQGSYRAGGIGSYYESSKSDSPIRVRTGKPLPTFGLAFPSLPAGYSVKALYYLDDGFIIRSTSTDPAGLDTTYPYVVMLFRKDDDSAINVTDFIALNRTLQMPDHTKFPEITGSAYVGAGCIVRGDVKLIGDPYVNRVFDVNQWDRGGVAYSAGKSWGEMKDGSNPSIRMSSKHIYPVSPGDTISLTGPYRLGIVYFNADKKAVHDTSWGTGTFTAPDGCFYMGLSFSSSPDGKFIDFSDLALANVKYVRAFKKRRYITNELDRTSPEDILLGPDYWEQGSLALDVGSTYEGAKIEASGYIRLKRLVNAGGSSTYTKSASYAFNRYEFDAVTRYLSPDGGTYGRALLGSLVRKEPPANTVPADVTEGRVVLEFTPTPRIIVPYGSDTLRISGPKIRMYDNAVLSRNLNQEGEIVLQGDAIMGYDFNSGSCMCSNGHSDAIIKLP